MGKLSEWTKEVSKFCYEHFKLIAAVSVVTALGGIIALIFHPIFAIIFPLWIIFAAFVFKQQYARKVK